MTTNVRLRPLVIALALSVPLLGGCGQKSPESRIEDAKQALQKADNKTAIIELKTALQEAPNNWEARLILGETLQTVSQWDNSEKELKKALELGAPPERALPMLAKSLNKLSRHKEVLELAIPSVGVSSSSLASIQAEVANANISLNKLSDAKAAISEGEKILTAAGGQTYSNHMQLAKARLAYIENQIVQAQSILDAALARDSKFVDAIYLKAQIFLAEEKPKEALKEYEKIITIKPNELMAHLSIVEIKLQEKDLAAAEKSMRMAEQLDNNLLLVKYTKAKVSLVKGDYIAANESLKQILRAVPDHLPSMILDAAVSYYLGNYENSLKSAKKVATQIPGHLYASKLIAANELLRGNGMSALATLEPLLPAHPQDPVLLSLLGQASLQNKQYDKATAYFDRGAALQPGNVGIKQGQARGRLALGQVDQAVLHLEQAVKLSEKIEQADISLVTLLLHRKDYDKALTAIDNFEQKAPDSPVPSNLRGVAYLGKNDLISARKAFQKALTIKPSFFTAAANLARLDLADKNPKAAKARFETLLNKDSQNVQAMMALSELAASGNQQKEFTQWLERASKADPKAIEPRIALVRYYLRHNDPQKALVAARDAVNADTNSPEALSLLGSAQMALGDTASALSSFTRLTVKAPDSAEAHFRLGAALVAGKNAADARYAFEKALALQPDHVNALDGLLALDIAEHNNDKALKRARNFQVANPKLPVGFVREADLLYAQGQLAKAINAYEAGLSRGIDLHTFSKMQIAIIKSGNHKLADQKVNELLTRFPKDRQVKMFAGEHYLGLGRNAEAKKHFEDLLKNNTSNISVLNNLAIAYQRLNDPRALTLAEQAYKLAPNNYSIMDTLGWIHVTQGKPERALSILKQAKDKSPNSMPIKYHLAVALAKTGKSHEARVELEEIVKGGKIFAELEDAKKLLLTLKP